MRNGKAGGGRGEVGGREEGDRCFLEGRLTGMWRVYAAVAMVPKLASLVFYRHPDMSFCPIILSAKLPQVRGRPSTPSIDPEGEQRWEAYFAVSGILCGQTTDSSTMTRQCPGDSGLYPPAHSWRHDDAPFSSPARVEEPPAAHCTGGGGGSCRQPAEVGGGYRSAVSPAVERSRAGERKHGTQIRAV